MINCVAQPSIISLFSTSSIIQEQKLFDFIHQMTLKLLLDRVYCLNTSQCSHYILGVIAYLSYLICNTLVLIRF